MKNFMQGAVRLIAVVGIICLANSCYRLSDMPGKSTEVITKGDLSGRVDFAVAPIIDQREKTFSSLPEEQLRRAFQTGLLRRRYSPLSLEFVDSRVVDAGYVPGSSQEDAVLQITIEEWDDSLWEIHRALIVSIEAIAIDPSAPEGAVLWKARSERRFDKDEFGDPAHQPTESQRLQHACNVIAAEILTAMPARTEAPGRL